MAKSKKVKSENGERKTIGGMVIGLIAKGVSKETGLKRVRDAFPDKKVPDSCWSWWAWKSKQSGSAKPKKAKRAAKAKPVKAARKPRAKKVPREAAEAAA